MIRQCNKLTNFHPQNQDCVFVSSLDVPEKRNWDVLMMFATFQTAVKSIQDVLINLNLSPYKPNIFQRKSACSTWFSTGCWRRWSQFACGCFFRRSTRGSPSGNWTAPSSGPIPGLGSARCPPITSRVPSFGSRVPTAPTTNHGWTICRAFWTVKLVPWLAGADWWGFQGTTPRAKLPKAVARLRLARIRTFLMRMRCARWMFASGANATRTNSLTTTGKPLVVWS